MFKFLISTFLFASAAQAVTVGDMTVTTGNIANFITVVPTALTESLNASTKPVNKELMIAAEDDAVDFLEADGKIQKSILLKSAFQELATSFSHTESLTDVEKAQAILYLAAQ